MMSSTELFLALLIFWVTGFFIGYWYRGYLNRLAEKRPGKCEVSQFDGITSDIQAQLDEKERHDA